MRNWVEENLSPKQRITIRQRGGGINDTGSPAESQMLSVTAPLPDGFGMTVGSEYGTPFDTGGVNDMLSKLFAIGKISQKAGIRMEKMYMNPEPTEISFDMEFYAWYDAKTEVLLPAATLMVMSLGRKLDYPELVEKVKGFYQKVVGTVGIDDHMPSFGGEETSTVESEQGEVEKGLSKIVDLIHIIQGPPKSEIRFGDFMVLPECYITSVATSFSNSLDPDGVPMSCKCSVTATLNNSPIADDVYTYFDVMGNK